MIVFALPEHRPMLPAELGERSEPALGSWRHGRFPDGEMWLELSSPVEGRDCVLLGSLAPPDEQTLRTLLLAHTLRRAGAARVIALLPYLGYARQDRAASSASLGAEWAGTLLAAAGVERVLSIDLHSGRAARCLSIPVTSLSPARLFAAHLSEGDRDRHRITVVAPDDGAVKRAADLAAAMGSGTPVAHLSKSRTPAGVEHLRLVGEILPRVVIVDDILDTGGTLLSACAMLRRAGASEISIVVTHGTLSGEHWRKLPDAGASRILLTDTVPGVRARGRGVVEVIGVAPLLMDALAGLG